MKKELSGAGNIANNRQKEILHYLEEHQSATVEELCSLLNLSPATIRRDLNVMDNSGFLIRVYGGAVLKTSKTDEQVSLDREDQMFTFKAATNISEKDRIARAAARLIPDNAIIFVNSGSTTFKFIDFIKSQKVTIVTNNAAAASINEDYSADLLFLGGCYCPTPKSFVGPMAITAMQDIFSTITILGTNGFSPVRGLTTTISQECSINRTMVDHTLGKVIVLADHDKIGVTSNFVSVPLSLVDILVTDRPLDKEIERKLKECDIEIIIAGE